MKMFVAVLLTGATLCAGAAASPVNVDPMRVPAGTYALAADPTPTGLPAGSYLLDPGRSKVSARITFFGLARRSTSFSRLNGRLDYNPQDWEATRVVITLDPRSLSNPGSPVGREMTTLLEPDKFPVIVFRSRMLVADHGGPRLVGDLTLHGVTRPLTLEMAFRGRRTDERTDGARVAFSGSGRIRRSDFGMAAMRGLVRDQVDLFFDAEFAAKPAAIN
jgi:polyisoprenoid-binding protein YceI